MMVERSNEWIEAITHVWTNSAARQRLGEDARAWAIREHSWQRTAVDAVNGLQSIAHEEAWIRT
jgi:hypothetical protein